MCLPKWKESTLHLGERLIEGDFDKLAIALQEWALESVLIVLEVFEGRAFRAQKAMACHVVLIASDERNVAVLHGDLKTAGRLAQGADMEMLRGVGHEPTSTNGWSAQPVS